MHISGATIDTVQGLFQGVLSSTAKIDDLLRADAYSPQTAETVIGLAGDAARDAQVGSRLIGTAMRTKHAWVSLPNRSYLCTDLHSAKAAAQAVSETLAQTAGQMRSGDWAQSSTIRTIMERSEHVIKTLESERILHGA